MADEGLYEKQRKFRERYPVADAALNFVPYVGTAAAIDDVQDSVRKGDYTDAALNAIGVIPGGKVVKGAIKGFNKVDNAARRAMVRNGRPTYQVNDVSDALLAAGTAAAAGGVGAYGTDLAIRQAKADSDSRSYKKGGKVKTKVSSASKRGDGIAQRGKTRGTFR